MSSKWTQSEETSPPKIFITNSQQKNRGNNPQSPYDLPTLKSKHSWNCSDSLHCRSCTWDILGCWDFLQLLNQAALLPHHRAFSSREKAFNARDLHKFSTWSSKIHLQFPFWFAKFARQELFEAFSIHHIHHKNISRNLRCLIDDLIATIITIARLTLGVPYKTSRKVFSVQRRFPFNGRFSKVDGKNSVRGTCWSMQSPSIPRSEAEQIFKFSKLIMVSLCFFVCLRVSSCDKADKGPWLHGWWSSLMQWARCNASGDSSPVARGLVDKCSFVVWGCFKYFGKNFLSRE